MAHPSADAAKQVAGVLNPPFHRHMPSAAGDGLAGNTVATRIRSVFKTLGARCIEHPNDSVHVTLQRGLDCPSADTGMRLPSGRKGAALAAREGEEWAQSRTTFKKR